MGRGTLRDLRKYLGELGNRRACTCVLGPVLFKEFVILVVVFVYTPPRCSRCALQGLHTELLVECTPPSELSLSPKSPEAIHPTYSRSRYFIGSTGAFFTNSEGVRKDNLVLSQEGS